MANPSDESIERIRSELISGANGLAASARRVIRARAVLLWLAMGLGALILILVSDMLLRREELGLRILSLVVWLAVIAFAAVKIIRPAWQFSPTLLQVTRWIELGRPEFGEQLSTALELAGLPAGDSRFGSQGFRDNALREWHNAGYKVDWHRHLNTRGLRQAGVAIAIAIGLTVGLAILWPAELRTAVARLAMPWSVYRWPQRDNLQLKNPPHVVALGSELQLEIIDTQPPLPEKVELQFRPATDSALRPTSLDTIQVDALAIGNLPAIMTAMEVRAIGGDDSSMPWRRIDVVRPPDLEKFQYSIQPPNYTGLPAITLVGRRITVLSGSQIEFSGTFSEPLSQVELLFWDTADLDSANLEAGPNPATLQPELGVDQQKNVWTAKLAADGRTLQISAADNQPLRITGSMHWQFSVVTRDGLEVVLPDHWSIEIVEDTPPLVAMQPAELPELAPTARIPLRGRASDDHGLAELVAKMRIDNAANAEPFSLELWSANSTENFASQRETQINAAWQIANTTQLLPGQQITLWLEALDNAGQVGRSQPQTFAILEPDDLVGSVQDKQNQLLARVRELVETQRRNAQLFARNWHVAREANQVEREQLDIFRNVAQVQHAIGQQFNGDETSLTVAVTKLSQVLTQNQLEESELATELKTLNSTILQLAENELKSATSLAKATADEAQVDMEQASAIGSILTNAAESTSTAQADALRSLESLLDRLAKNESVQQVQRELAQILSQQNALRADTDQLQLERLEQSLENRIRDRKTALSSDQQGLARRLDDLAHRANELRDGAADDQKALRSQMDRLSKALTESQASGKMRRATEEIREEKFVAATSTQQQVSDLLTETLRQLGAVNQSQLGNLQHRADDLRQTSQQLAELADAQSSLAEQLDAQNASQQQDSLVRQQADLRQDTQSASERVSQAGDTGLANQIKEAAGLQQEAESSAGQGNLAAAAQAAQAAATQLAQTAAELDKRVDQLEQAVIEQQISQLTTAIGRLATEQQPVAEEFAQLPALQADAREEEQAAVRQLAARQEAVRILLRDVRSQTSKLTTFDWTLAQAENAMSRAVAAAERLRVHPDASDAARSALRLLELAASALQSSTPPQDGSESAEPQEKSDQSDPSSADSDRPIPVIASLKLLRSLQQEINAETDRIESVPNVEARSAKLSELSTMQQALGKQIAQLLREFAAANDTGPTP